MSQWRPGRRERRNNIEVCEFCRSELPRAHTAPDQDDRGFRSNVTDELLGRDANAFDFLTADQNLPYQQDLSLLPIAVAVFVAKQQPAWSRRLG